jgi:hypothetical protein
MRPSEEVGHRLREVPQRLLLHHLAARPQLVMLRPRLSELTASLHVAGGTSAPWTPPRLLLHREVPDEPGVRAVRPQHWAGKGTRRYRDMQER